MITVSSSLASLPVPASASSNAFPARKAASNGVSDLVQLQSGGSLASLVRPTEAQQVRQLYRQGHTVPQISSTLNLSAQAVDSYLNIAEAAR